MLLPVYQLLLSFFRGFDFGQTFDKDLKNNQNSMQTWKIKGQVYTHAQLMELKRQGLDPRKDDIVMKFITNPQPEVKPEEKKASKKEVVSEVPELPTEPEAPEAPEAPVVEEVTEPEESLEATDEVTPEVTPEVTSEVLVKKTRGRKPKAKTTDEEVQDQPVL